MEDFFALIQLAIGSRESFGKKLSEKEWAEIMEIAEKQALLGILYLGVEKLGSASRPPSLMTLELYAKVLIIEKVNKKSLANCIRLQQHLRNQGIDSCVLKGIGMAAFYDRWSLRQCGDIDIWIDGDRDEIVKMCREYNPEIKPVFHNAPFAFIEGTSIEAHFTPNWMYWPVSNRRMQRWFESQKACQMQNWIAIDDADLTIPTLAFNRIFILSHIYRHLFGEGIGLKQVLDYYYVLRQGFSEEERAETLKVLHSLNMIRFARAMMWVLQSVFALEDRFLLLEPDENEGRFLLNEIMLSGNLGAFDKRKTIRSNYGVVRFYNHVCRNFRFLNHYPYETLGTPLFKLWHFCWRKKKGYI